MPVAQRVLAIPVKRFERASVRHLTRPQMQTLLDAPDPSTQTGLRDRVLLGILYNTGARVSEVAALTVADLRLDTGGSLHIRGKGRKQRTVPLWRQSLRLIRTWLRQTDASSTAPLVPNGRGGHMTRSGIEHRLKVAVERAARTDSSLRRVRISPHTIRHTTAMHLLQSGVDLSVIAMWLGHESTQTTHQYLDADLESKKRAGSPQRPKTCRLQSSASRNGDAVPRTPVIMPSCNARSPPDYAAMSGRTPHNRAVHNFFQRRFASRRSHRRCCRWPGRRR